MSLRRRCFPQGGNPISLHINRPSFTAAVMLRCRPTRLGVDHAAARFRRRQPYPSKPRKPRPSRVRVRLSRWLAGRLLVWGAGGIAGEIRMVWSEFVGPAASRGAAEAERSGPVRYAWQCVAMVAERLGRQDF